MNTDTFIRQKRRVIFLLSSIVSALFLGFVIAISMANDTVSGLTFVSLGLLLIVSSIAAVTLYGVWANQFRSKLQNEHDQ